MFRFIRKAGNDATAPRASEGEEGRKEVVGGKGAEAGKGVKGRKWWKELKGPK